MTRGEAIEFMQSTLSFRTDQHDFLASRIKNAQVWYESRPQLPDFLKSERYSINTVAGEERVPKPSGFLMEWEEDALFYVSESTDEDNFTGERALIKQDLDLLRAKYSDWDGSTTPKHYAFDGTYFRVFPVDGTKTYELKLIFYEKDQILSGDGSENKWMLNCPFLFIGRALYWAATAFRDKEAQAVAASMIQEEEANYLASSTAREITNRRYALGETN